MVRKLNVYLAGPISGLTFQDATGWRRDTEVLERLEIAGWEALDPLEGWEHLDSDAPIPVFFEDEYTENGATMAVLSDLHQILSSQAILQNLTGATRVSTGTMAEMGYAYAHGKPIVTVMEPGSIHEHPFVHTLSHAVYPTLEQGIGALAELHALMVEIPYA